jgi:uncharacterized iron-regulated membrane protein
MKPFRFFWTTHKWVGVCAALLVLNTAVTGILLLVKKSVPWVQPPEVAGAAPGELTVSFDQVLATLRSVPEAEVRTWQDVDRMDVRPGKGMLKVRCRNGWEVQVDGATGAALYSALRRSDLIEQIHDGSFYGAVVHDWVMPAFAVGLLFLTGSGLYLWLEPKLRRRRTPRRVAAAAAAELRKSA